MIFNLAYISVKTIKYIQMTELPIKLAVFTLCSLHLNIFVITIWIIEENLQIDKEAKWFTKQGKLTCD